MCGGSEVDKRAGLKRKFEGGEAAFFQGDILWLSAFVGSKTEPSFPKEG